MTMTLLNSEDIIHSSFLKGIIIPCLRILLSICKYYRQWAAEHNLWKDGNVYHWYNFYILYHVVLQKVFPQKKRKVSIYKPNREVIYVYIYI